MFTSTKNLKTFETLFQNYDKVKLVTDDMINLLIKVEECIYEANKV